MKYCKKKRLQLHDRVNALTFSNPPVLYKASSCPVIFQTQLSASILFLIVSNDVLSAVAAAQLHLPRRIWQFRGASS